MLVVVAVDESSAGEVADDEAGVGEAHVHPVGQLRHRGGAGDRERDQRADVALTEPAGLLEGRRQLAPAPPERKPQLREQRCEPGNVDTDAGRGQIK